eukprot:s406_g17.t1
MIDGLDVFGFVFLYLVFLGSGISNHLSCTSPVKGFGHSRPSEICNAMQGWSSRRLDLRQGRCVPRDSDLSIGAPLSLRLPFAIRCDQTTLNFGDRKPTKRAGRSSG